MSRFTGRQQKGAMAALRTKKREEAEARNASADSIHTNTRGHRLGRCSCGVAR